MGASHLCLIKKQKIKFSAIIDDLEQFAETRLLYDQGFKFNIQSNGQIARPLCEDKLKWYQNPKLGLGRQ
jgi:hypothetical protein